jgi:hypothetical protein
MYMSACARSAAGTEALKGFYGQRGEKAKLLHCAVSGTFGGT